MAYFFGMYVNGIAIYGRDPLLTCQYARFISEDQRCPALFDMDESVESTGVLHLIVDGLQVFLTSNGDNVDPSDWRNCSSKGYHP